MSILITFKLKLKHGAILCDTAHVYRSYRYSNPTELYIKILKK